jgi:hypothetical protein
VKVRYPSPSSISGTVKVRYPSPSSISGTRRIMLIINPLISRKGEEKVATSLDGTYSWSFVIFHHG